MPRPSPDNVSASLDLRLGRWFITMRDNRFPILDIGDNEGRAMENIGIEEFESKKHAKEKFVPFGEKYILHPRRFVLAATLEWIKLPNDLMGLVTGKSSWARRGLSVEGAPGVHPGFSGCLTLEISNHGVVPIELRAGMKICQLFLLQMANVQKTKAQDDNNQEEMKPTVHGMQRKPTIGSIKIDKIVERLKSSN